jgi:hypothetical protein
MIGCVLPPVVHSYKILIWILANLPDVEQSVAQGGCYIRTSVVGLYLVSKNEKKKEKKEKEKKEKNKKKGGKKGIESKIR